MTKQTNIFATQDWKKIYTTFSEADFQSYDFETLRKVLVDYVKTYYPEDFNDFIESSEYVALLDLIAFTAQGIAFRTDLNARENFLETAERRDSVLKLVKQLNYNPNRNRSSSGLLKIISVQTTENLQDINNQNISRVTINWNDANNANWSTQMTQILNAAFGGTQKVGKPFASKTINGVRTEQYNLAVPNTILPVFGFSSLVAQNTLPFEVVSANILTTDTISELDPGTRGQFGILYQNDSRGNSSANTGFFLYFKQGSINSLDFAITEKIANRVFSINNQNVNDSDIWMYEINNNVIGTEWTKVPSTAGSNAVYNSTARGIRTLYSINTRINDQIDLVFGDGSFADIPLGNYRVYFRTSNGQTYRISPADMANITVAIPYISKNGRTETLTFNASLQYTVSNSSRRDLTNEIKSKAPQAYYTQNRMVNGEDYNILPYTTYSDIVKVKSVNRFASGVSRGLDITDPTGKYTSTDIYAKDGVFYKNNYNQSFDFTFASRNDILTVINNQVMTVMADYPMRHFYYENYSAINMAILAPTTWSRSTDDTTSCTGFFLDAAGDIQVIGSSTTSYRKYLLVNSLVKFVAPTGYYFDVSNNLVAGTATLDSDKTAIWTSIRGITGSGATTTLVAGRNIGAVTLSENIPTGAVLSLVYAPYSTNFQTATINSLTSYILNKNDFALVYDYTKTSGVSDPWTVIPSNKINTGNFNLSTQYGSSDSSWLLRFSYDGQKYTVTYRQQDFIFGSSSQVRFINTNPRTVYDPATNSLVKDNIRILKINTLILNDINLGIYKNITESDGYTDSTRVYITYPVNTTSGLPTDPEIFTELNSGAGYIFYKKFIDTDNLVRYALQDMGVINYNYKTKSDINFVRNNFSTGKVFYATTDLKFWQITATNGVKTLADVSDQYFAFTGRQDLIFEYQHNAENTRRIDPAASNLIDTYILTRSYDESYRNYVIDQTGIVSKPVDLDSVTLNNSYSDLFQYKMISDEMILNPGVYKLLFGNKANRSLQANFQVVKSMNTVLSDTEIKSRVVDAINQYFALENWDFGDTFYFSELAAYLHQQLQGYVSSIILVPVDTTAPFGSLYEIRCQPNEIFLNCATVENIQIVQSVLSGINNAGITTTTVY
jgi:hypothetical protein